jgi:putative ABC transport system permease protein
VNILKLAWRNVWRNSRRSTITILAMTVALWVELLYSGMMQGMLVDMTSDVTELDLGDVQVFTTKWQDRPSLHEAVHDEQALLDRLDAEGYAATGRLQAGGLAASGDQSAGVMFVGLDPARDAKVLAVDQAIGEGRWLDVADPHGVVVGRGLARTLGLKLGSEVVVLSQAADGTMANDLYTVRGVLKSVAASTDRSGIFLTEGAFRELFVFPEGAHKIVVRAPKGVPLDVATAKVASLAPGLDVQSWQQLNPFIAQMLDAAHVQMKVIYFVMYTAVGILVLNSMLMAVFERIREFGVLKAIGYGPVRVAAMMVLEGLFQALVAAVVGIGLALPCMVYLSRVGIDVGRLGGVAMLGMSMPTIWRGAYSVDVCRVPVEMLFAIVLVAVLPPALKAAWIRPVDAMHHQ